MMMTFVHEHRGDETSVREPTRSLRMSNTSEVAHSYLVLLSAYFRQSYFRVSGKDNP